MNKTRWIGKRDHSVSLQEQHDNPANWSNGVPRDGHHVYISYVDWHAMDGFAGLDNSDVRLESFNIGAKPDG